MSAGRASGRKRRMAICWKTAIASPGQLHVGQPYGLGRVGVADPDVAEHERGLLGLRRVGDDVDRAARDIDEVAALQDDLLAVAAVALGRPYADLAVEDVPAHVVLGVIVRR